MRLRYIVGLFAGLLLSSMAYAEGFYVGASVDLTQIEDEEAGVDFDDNAVGWRVLAGYEFTNYFAVEGGYLDSGDAEDSVLGVDVDVEITGFTLFAVGQVPMSDTWTLFGKAGYYDGEAEVSLLGFSVDDDESGLALGAGVRVDLSDNIALRGEFDWFDSDLDSLWSVGIGIEYRFSM